MQAWETHDTLREAPRRAQGEPKRAGSSETTGFTLVLGLGGYETTVLTAVLGAWKLRNQVLLWFEEPRTGVTPGGGGSHRLTESALGVLELHLAPLG